MPRALNIVLLYIKRMDSSVWMVHAHNQSIALYFSNSMLCTYLRIYPPWFSTSHYHFCGCLFWPVTIPTQRALVSRLTSCDNIEFKQREGYIPLSYVLDILDKIHSNETKDKYFIALGCMAHKQWAQVAGCQERGQALHHILKSTKEHLAANATIRVISSVGNR